MTDEKLILEDDDNTFAKEALLCEIGAKLQQAREVKGLSQDQVVKELKFSLDFLSALESGTWSEMPGEIYALGFLRQYATLLNLDVSNDIQRIKSSTYELTTPLTYPDAPISPNRTWVIVAILLFFLIAIMTNLFNFEDVDQAPVKPIEKSTVIPAPTETELTPDTTLNQDVEVAEEQKLVIEAPLPALASEENNGTKLDTLVQQPSSGQPTHIYTFVAVSDDVWLQVYQSIAGEEPKLRREVLLRMGQRFNLDSDSTLLLTSGKPTALQVLVDNQVLFEAGTLGEEDKVLKLFPLQEN